MDDGRAAAVAASLRTAVRRAPVTLQVEGRSMGRWLPSGSAVEVVPGGSRPRPGEVWVFVDEAALVVVHRVVARRGAITVLRGDGRTSRGDERALPAALVGRVRSVGQPRRPVRRRLVPVVRWWVQRAGERLRPAPRKRHRR